MENDIKHKQFFEIINLSSLIIASIIIQVKNVELFSRLFEDTFKKNKELTEYKEQQITLQKLKDGFFATVSHELRTPLNAIKGCTDLLISNKVPENEKVELIQTINYSSNFMLILVNDVLDFSKINENKFSLTESDFNLEENITHCFNVHKSLANNKGLNYKLIKKNPLPKLISGDAQRLSQIIINLISNAIKYTNRGEVVVEYGGDYNNSIFNLNIKIIDTGVGIEASKIDTIFEKYVQVSSNHTNGIGLGLYITSNIIKQKKGTIMVESKWNYGSTFTVSIPYNVIEKIEINSEKIVSEKLSNLSVLVIDDNQINLIVTKKILLSQISNCDIELTLDGANGVIMATNNYYDVILMDIQMPGLDGIEAAKQIRKNNINTPIIAVTANTIYKVKEDCFRAGMNGLITKPFEITDLISAIKRVVKGDK